LVRSGKRAPPVKGLEALRIGRSRTLEVTAPRGLHVPVDAIWPQVVGRVNRLFDRHVHRVPNHLNDLLAVALDSRGHKWPGADPTCAVLKCRAVRCF
jgi:hypothetical protein